MRSGYKTVVDYVRQFGDDSAPRDDKTWEIVAPTIVLLDPTDSLPIGCDRGLKSGIAAVEAAQLVAGCAIPEMVLNASANFNRFIEPDGTFHGAYGNRIGTQFDAVAAKLDRDEETRQAVITLWDPLLDTKSGKKDYPCTIGFQFLIRDYRLHMITTMRSNDVWWGLAYDIFQFTQLQISLANALDVELGTYVHQPGSLHLYVKNSAQSMLLAYGTEPHPPTRTGFGRPGQTALQVRHRAKAILYGDTVDDATPSERWYIDTLKPLRP